MRISDWSSDVCSSDLIAGQMLEHGDIDRLGRRAQHRLVGRLGEVGQKLVERAEARGRIAPEQAGERREMMALDRVNFLGREAALRQADGAETAGLLVAPGAPGDLRHFRNRTAAQAPARSDEHQSELPSLMRISYADFSLKKNNKK